MTWAHGLASREVVPSSTPRASSYRSSSALLSPQLPTTATDHHWLSTVCADLAHPRDHGGRSLVGVDCSQCLRLDIRQSCSRRISVCNLTSSLPTTVPPTACHRTLNHFHTILHQLPAVLASGSIPLTALSPCSSQCTDLCSTLPHAVNRSNIPVLSFTI